MEGLDVFFMGFSFFTSSTQFVFLAKIGMEIVAGDMWQENM